MQIIQVEAFRFDELSVDAKQKVMNEVSRDDDTFYEDVLYDAKYIGELMGIHINDIYFSGFWSQGDGASFDGTYIYNDNAIEAIKQATNNSDPVLVLIVAALHAIQTSCPAILRANCKQSGHYCNSANMQIDVYTNFSENTLDISAAKKELSNTLRSFADWIYGQLKKAYEYSISETYIREVCSDNDYYFNKRGELMNVTVAKIW